MSSGAHRTTCRIQRPHARPARDESVANAIAMTRPAACHTAAATMDYYRDGQHVGQRKVVTGEPDKTTPQLQSPISRLVANPTWTVPESIYEDELADKGPGYFAANNMIRKNGRIVQQPGPKNSLGQVNTLTPLWAGNLFGSARMIRERVAGYHHGAEAVQF